MKQAVLLIWLMAAAAFAQQEFLMILDDESPEFNNVVGVRLDSDALKALLGKWVVGKAVPGEVTNPERLADLGVANLNKGDKVKVTYLGRERTKEKLEIAPSGSGKTSLARVESKLLQKK